VCDALAAWAQRYAGLGYGVSRNPMCAAVCESAGGVYIWVAPCLDNEGVQVKGHYGQLGAGSQP